MYLASAYPNSALSALTMMVIGLIVAASLAVWLGLVFLADREPHTPTGGLPREPKGAAVPGLGSEERSDEQRGKALR
jgi:hypothetical protein